MSILYHLRCHFLIRSAVETDSTPEAEIRFLSMPSDAERFRFLADHELSVVWYDSGASISWRENWPEPGKTAGYVLLSRGKTLEEAVDNVIERWERKHGVSRAKQIAALVQLEVRGWVS